MTRMNIKKIMSLTLAILVVTSLVGCAKKGEKDPLLSEKKASLVEKIHGLEEEIEYRDFTEAQDADRIKELEEMLRGISSETTNNSELKTFDKTGKLTMYSNDDIVTLPQALVYPRSVQSSNSSMVMVSKDVSVKPSSNWIVKFNANEAILQHSSGITGKIIVGTIDRQLGTIPTVDEIKEAISTFFSTLPPDNVTYNRVYIGNTLHSGYDAMSKTIVDEKPGFIRCGLIGNGTISVTYFFFYEGEPDTSKDELIMTLLQTMTILNGEVKIGS